MQTYSSWIRGKKGFLERDIWAGSLRNSTSAPDKPALVFGHYNMTPNRGVRPIRGLLDGPDLLEALTQRKHVRAYFYGHTHEWQHTRKKHLHLIGQPAVGYYFWERTCPWMARYETF